MIAHVGGLLVISGLVAMLALVAIRKGWILAGRRIAQAGAFPPAMAAAPSRTSRCVEAIVLGIAAVVVLSISATYPSSGGYLLMLGELRPDYAMANVVMFLCALVGVVVGVLVTFFGRTVAGAIILGVVLGGYGLVLHGDSRPGQWFLPENMCETSADYTINLGGTNVQGAELWVNGVLLGRTPYATTLDEFEAKVPYWPEPPADYKTDILEVRHYDAPPGRGTSIYRRWASFDLLEHPRSYARSRGEPRPKPPRKIYYAKARFAGEWGTATGSSGGFGSGDGIRFHANQHIDFIFPERQKRLDALLNKARLNNYRAVADWFQSLETYGQDGWIALQRAAKTEPRMTEVLDGWAAWRYGLDKVTDSESAWLAFERICEEADSERRYLTASPAGHAVEMLTPRLPQERLVAEAVRIMRDTGSLGYSTRTEDGRFSFGYSERPGGDQSRVGSSSSGASYGAGRFPIRGFAVAHAIWRLNDLLRSENAPLPNIVQERIVPELIRSHRRGAPKARSLRVAAYFGGPAIDTFLLRQPWRLPADQLPWTERGSGHGFAGREINEWLYLLALLDDDAGREFRREHMDALMDLGDTVAGSFVSYGWSRSPLFSDPWFAEKYWPRFARLAREKSHERLKTQWEYLADMGDAATVDMFVESWKETNLKAIDFPFALEVLDRLKPPMQRQVFDALIRQVKEHPQNLAELVWKPDGPPESVVSKIRAYDRQAELERVLSELQKGSRKNIVSLGSTVWDYVPLWLAHARQASPLVARLAASDKPELRMLVMDALREYPIPRNQELLQGLLKDPNAAVRASAERVSQHLKSLAGQKPAQYASEP